MKTSVKEKKPKRVLTPENKRFRKIVGIIILCVIALALILVILEHFDVINTIPNE